MTLATSSDHILKLTKTAFDQLDSPIVQPMYVQHFTTTETLMFIDEV